MTQAQSNSENKEVKAFILQQIQELEPYLRDWGPASVYVEQVKPKDKSQSQKQWINFIVQTQDLEVIGLGNDKNIYNAYLNAKTDLVKKLESLNSLDADNSVRSNLIDFLSNSKYLH